MHRVRAAPFFRKLSQGIGPAIVPTITAGPGYFGANEGNQTAEAALCMHYPIPAAYAFSTVIQFIGPRPVYSPDKKSPARMNAEFSARHIKG